MKPQKEIAPGLSANINLIPGKSGAIADLPAYYDQAYGTYTTRWKLTLRERIRVFLCGNIWLNVMGRLHPPVRIDVFAPFEIVKTRIPWDSGYEELKPELIQKQNEAQIQSEQRFKPEDFTGAEDDTLEPEDEEEKKKRTGDDDRGFYS